MIRESLVEEQQHVFLPIRIVEVHEGVQRAHERSVMPSQAFGLSQGEEERKRAVFEVLDILRVVVDGEVASVVWFIERFETCVVEGNRHDLPS